MILIDTHIWIWWSIQPGKLTSDQQNAIRSEQDGIIGVSAISCWEVAKLTQLARIDLGMPISDWIGLALSYPGVQLLPLTPQIAIASTQLLGDFRSDPADEILVATARLYECSLVTSDRKIRAYAHVSTI